MVYNHLSKIIITKDGNLITGPKSRARFAISRNTMVVTGIHYPQIPIAVKGSTPNTDITSVRAGNVHKRTVTCTKTFYHFIVVEFSQSMSP